MTELSDTAFIAERLFGWNPINCPKGFNSALKWYESAEEMYRVGVDAEGKAQSKPNNWPNFSHEINKHYWVRRMEDALAEKGLGKVYAKTLVARFDFIDDTFDAVVVPCLRATAAQRVAACVKVLREVDAKAAADAAKEEESQRKTKFYREAMRAKVAELKTKMRCNCDLDNWEPEPITGHSHVCRIHKAAIEAVKYPTVLREVQG